MDIYKILLGTGVITIVALVIAKFISSFIHEFAHALTFFKFTNKPCYIVLGRSTTDSESWRNSYIQFDLIKKKMRLYIPLYSIFTLFSNRSAFFNTIHRSNYDITPIQIQTVSAAPYYNKRLVWVITLVANLIVAVVIGAAINECSSSYFSANYLIYPIPLCIFNLLLMLIALFSSPIKIKEIKASNAIPPGKTKKVILLVELVLIFTGNVLVSAMCYVMNKLVMLYEPLIIIVVIMVLLSLILEYSFDYNNKYYISIEEKLSDRKIFENPYSWYTKIKKSDSDNIK